MKVVVFWVAFFCSSIVLGGKVTVPIYSENGNGIAMAFDHFESVEFSRTNELAVCLPYNRIWDKRGICNFRKTASYPVPMSYSKSTQITNCFVCLKKGEGICWGFKFDFWGCMSYISGKDIPAEIECPKAYRESTEIIHYLNKQMFGRFDQNILFDPKRKKQFNVTHPWEFDYPHFPYRRGMAAIAYAESVKGQILCLCEIVRARTAFLVTRGFGAEQILISFPCDYAVCEQECRINGNPKEYCLDKVDFDVFSDYKNVTNAYTNLIVSVRSWKDRLKTVGFVVQSSIYAPKCVLLDDDERLMMTQSFDFDSPIQVDWFHDDEVYGLKKYDADGNEVTGIPYDELNREFERKRNAAFGWSGPFTIERLRERVAADAERIRKARESEKK